MSRLLLIVLTILCLFAFTPSAEAVGPFLFPNVAAFRINSQARALNAVANRNQVFANLQFSRNVRFNSGVRFHHGYRNNAVFFAAPAYYAPRVQVAAPVQYAAPVLALPTCHSYLPPVQALPTYSYYESYRSYGGY